MVTTVPQVTTYSGTVPNRSQSQSAFNTNTAAFLTYIDSFGPDLNSTVTNLNLATGEVNTNALTASGAASTATAAANATAYSAVATYNYPDTVIGSDGHAYRCIDTGVSGDNPVGSATGDWQPITTDTQNVIDRIDGRKNLLWNPDFTYNQEGALTATPGNYGPDFWFYPNEETGTSAVAHITGGVIKFGGGANAGKWAQLIDMRTFDSTGTIQVGGIFEGDYLTISADMESGYKMQVYAGYGTASGSNLTTTLAGELTDSNREVTFQVDYNSSTSTFLAIKLVRSGASSEDRFKNLKLNFGQKATLYEQPVFIEQEREANRWYRRSYSYGTASGSTTDVGAISNRNQSATGRTVIPCWPCRVSPMRGTPTITVYSSNSGASGNIYDVTGTADLTVSSIGQQSTTGFDEITFSAAVTAGNQLRGHFVFDARL